MVHLERFDETNAALVSTWAGSVDEVMAWCSLTEVPVPAELVVEWAADPNTEAYVLVDGDRLLGYGEIWIDNEEAEIELGHLIVDPAARGRGIGRTLTEALVEAGRRRHDDVFLRVVPENTAARRCYQSAGFVRVDEDRESAWNAGQPRNYVWMTAT